MVGAILSWHFQLHFLLIARYNPVKLQLFVKSSVSWKVQVSLKESEISDNKHCYFILLRTEKPVAGVGSYYSPVSFSSVEEQD